MIARVVPWVLAAAVCLGVALSLAKVQFEHRNGGGFGDASSTQMLHEFGWPLVCASRWHLDEPGIYVTPDYELIANPARNPPHYAREWFAVYESRLAIDAAFAMAMIAASALAAFQFGQLVVRRNYTLRHLLWGVLLAAIVMGLHARGMHYSGNWTEESTFLDEDFLRRNAERSALVAAGLILGMLALVHVLVRAGMSCAWRLVRLTRRVAFPGPRVGGAAPGQ